MINESKKINVWAFKLWNFSVGTSFNSDNFITRILLLLLISIVTNLCMKVLLNLDLIKNKVIQTDGSQHNVFNQNTRLYCVRALHACDRLISQREIIMFWRNAIAPVHNVGYIYTYLYNLLNKIINGYYLLYKWLMPSINEFLVYSSMLEIFAQKWAVRNN